MNDGPFFAAWPVPPTGRIEVVQCDGLAAAVATAAGRPRGQVACDVLSGDTIGGRYRIIDPAMAAALESVSVPAEQLRQVMANMVRNLALHMSWYSGRTTEDEVQDLTTRALTSPDGQPQR